MTSAPRRRGQPLIFLTLVIGSWVGARAMLWQPLPAMMAPAGLRLAEASVIRHGKAAVAAPLATPVMGVTVQQPELGGAAGEAAPMAPLPGVLAGPAPTLRPAPAPKLVLAPEPTLVPAGPPPRMTPGLAAGHQMLWMAAMSNLPPPRRTLPTLASAPQPLRPRLSPEANAAAAMLFAQSDAAALRWSADGWLLLRRGSGQGSGQGGANVPQSSYGNSQVGAVLRYRLEPRAHQIGAYLRVTGALLRTPGTAFERDAALGMSARPIAGVPLVVAVEARASRFDDGSVRLRPAGFAYTQMRPLPLPLGLRAEVYAAGGYVGGKESTAFVDGQLHADHALLHLGPTELRAGAGVWGGAERGAARLDVGPAASVDVAHGGIGARLGIDWRFRLAGNSAPGSGPTLTLSGGF